MKNNTKEHITSVEKLEIPIPEPQSDQHNEPTINDIFRSIAEEMADVVSRKNADYGNSYFKLRNEWGPMSFGARLGDKYYRLTNLLHGHKPQVDESVEDTIRDIIGYCLLELAYRKIETREEKE